MSRRFAARKLASNAQFIYLICVICICEISGIINAAGFGCVGLIFWEICVLMFSTSSRYALNIIENTLRLCLGDFGVDKI